MSDFPLADTGLALEAESAAVDADGLSVEFSAGADDIRSSGASWNSNARNYGQMARNANRSVNGISRVAEAMGLLDNEGGKAAQMARKAGGAMQITVGLYQFYKAIDAANKARRAREVSLAAGETTAAVVAQNYTGIAMAVSAAAAVTAGFAGGYIVSTRNVERSGPPLSEPAGQREYRRTVGGAMNG